MSDPRITFGVDTAGGDGGAVADALDRTRPIIRVDPALPPAGATAATALVLMLSRVFPHTTLEGDASLGPNPWGATTASDAVARSTGVVTAPTRAPDTDLVIGVGSASGPAALYVGGDDWTVLLSTEPVPVTAEHSGLGVHAGAALAAADVSKRVLSPLGMGAVLLPDQFTWNLLDHQLHRAPEHDRRRRARACVAALGCGSVGSSAAALFACVNGLTGDIWTVDSDTIDRDQNPFRYPALTGVEDGPKALWVADMLAAAGWTTRAHVGDVASWTAAQTAPGFYGIALSSVDSVDGRRDVADILARTTISAGVSGLALHLQVEQSADEFACPYCEFLDVRSALEESQMRAGMVGLSVERVVELATADAKLTEDDVQAAVRAGKVHAVRATELVGRRLDDLIRRVYAEAIVPGASDHAAPAAVSAPYVSWFTGTLMAAEVDKGALGLPLLHRRVDADLSGIPLGVTSARPRDTTGRCLCATPARRRWAARLYG